MAPSPNVFSMIPRQNGVLEASEIPSCVTQCMSEGDFTGCASSTDFECLCNSAAYSNSVALCWIGKCTSDDITIGMRYTDTICTSVSGGGSPVGNGTEVSGGNGTIIEAPGPILSGAPHIYQTAFVNVQAIMSAICAAVLLVAIVLGVLSCRTRLRAERSAAERSTWSGAATYAETKGGKSQLFSQNGQSTFNGATSRNFDTTTAFSSFSTHAPPVGGSINRPWPAATSTSGNNGGTVNRPGHAGFTNRLSITEPVPEEIEMSVQSSLDSPSGSGSSMRKEKAVSFDGESMVESPTTPTSRMGGESAYGSTVELTPKTKQEAFSKGTAF